MKQWKIALSLAVVGAVAAPFVFGTWKARPLHDVVVPLTSEVKERFVAYLERTNNCKDASSKNLCEYEKRNFEQGGRDVTIFSLEKYLAINLPVALGVFVAVFGLAFLIPAIVRAYWRWLNT